MSHKNFRAVTESGAVYELIHGLIHITKSTANTWEQVFKVGAIMTPIDGADPDDLYHPWVKPEQWQEVDEPIIGRRLYVSGRDEWRISTHIVSVEVLPDGED